MNQDFVGHKKTWTRKPWSSACARPCSCRWTFFLYITHTYLSPNVSRSSLNRCLVRHGLSRLTDIYPKDDATSDTPKKTFKDYEPGFLHIFHHKSAGSGFAFTRRAHGRTPCVSYLPKRQNEDQRRYLFVAIDRATRWVFLHVYDDMTETSSTDFLARVHAAAPMKISKILTDNGTQFLGRFTSKDKQPSGEHAAGLVR